MTDERGEDERRANERGNRKTAVWLIRVIALTAACFLFLLMFLLIWKKSSSNRSSSNRSEQEKAEQQTVHLFQKMPDQGLTDEEGKQVTATEKKVSVYIYWASWCSHCKESMKGIDEVVRTLKEEGAEVYLVDKLDGEKETREQALQFLKANSIQSKTYFDEGCRMYDAIGLHMIPTVIAADQTGVITFLSEGAMIDNDRVSAILQEAERGKAAFLADRMEQTMMNAEGGLRTNYGEAEGSLPSGSDVLSESQGILMEYAALAENKELFDKAYGYVRERMFPQGLMPWVISENEITHVNALIDDFRIMNALRIAMHNWEGYDESYRLYTDAIYRCLTQDNRLVDLYDAGTEQKADRLTLCYGDLHTLSELKEKDKRYRMIYENTLDTILQGRISEKFPLYYSYYSYAEGSYKGTELNMSEALTTLLHLAEAGELPEEALDWLEAELDKGVIYAKYGADGSPLQDGYYESTAVYALTAMTALTAGREALAGKAITRMEQFRISNPEVPYTALFGNLDGTGIYSFDQGMALLAYELFTRATR